MIILKICGYHPVQIPLLSPANVDCRLPHILRVNRIETTALRMNHTTEPPKEKATTVLETDICNAYCLSQCNMVL